MNRRFVLPLLVVLLVLLPVYVAAQAIPNDPDLAIQKFGHPSTDDSTAYDNPRPAIITRWLVWQRANVKLVYIADAPIGSPPPYKKWGLVGVTDPRNNKSISVVEALHRLTGGR